MKVGDVVTVKEAFINELVDPSGDICVMKGTPLVVLMMQKAHEGDKRVQFLAPDGKFVQYLGHLIHYFFAEVN